jgi:DNA-binding ferritin-like protein (Dps family)
MSKLQEIIVSTQSEEIPVTIPEAVEQIKDLMLEIIGEDEDGFSKSIISGERFANRIRNELRAKLRQKVKEL